MKSRYILLLIIIVLIMTFLVLFLFYPSRDANNPENLTGSLGTAGVFSEDGIVANENLTGELGTLSPTLSGNEVRGGIEDLFPDSKSMHWPNMPIKYTIANCTDYRLNRIGLALEYISNETEVISFQESSDYDIEIICINEQKDRGYVAGEAVLNYYVGTRIYAPSQVYIYHSNHCMNRRPTIEIHEVLHVFGLNHSLESEWGDIMNPYTTGCEAELSLEDSLHLKETYSEENRGNLITGNVVYDAPQIDVRISNILERISNFFK
jgi:hypothetical protein